MTQGYAYEIRFVDNDKVQVFDLARRHVDPTSATLPTEYKAEEVLRGDLRYSKLLGTQQQQQQQQPLTEEQWEHVTYTRRGRRSIQRHTFMMGSSSIEHDTIMDLEVGNKDIADIRLNNDNTYQNNNNIGNSSRTITEENTPSIVSQSTSFELSITEPLENSPDYNQSKHFESDDEVDMANIEPTTQTTKSPYAPNENKIMPEHQKNTINTVLNPSLYNDSISDLYLDNGNKYASNSSQLQSKEFNDYSDYYYSLKIQDEKIRAKLASNDQEDNMDSKYDFDNQFDKSTSLQHNSSSENGDENTSAIPNTLNHKVVYTENPIIEPGNNISPGQFNRQSNHLCQQQQNQMEHQAQLTPGKPLYFTSSNSVPVVTATVATPAAAITSTKKPSYYSNNVPMTNNIGNEALTRVKSVPLENYDASPERSCCIIS